MTAREIIALLQLVEPDTEIAHVELLKRTRYVEDEHTHVLFFDFGDVKTHVECTGVPAWDCADCGAWNDTGVNYCRMCSPERAGQ